jgi:predicted MFS family arabinose efflux permease
MRRMTLVASPLCLLPGARLVRAPAGRIEQFSTRIAFLCAGFGMAAWAPLVPFAKARAGLDDGMLGLLLLCLGAGSILAMPLSGALASRLGCRLVLLVSFIVVLLTLPVLATASSLPVLALALFLFGAGIGSADCVMNIQAVIVERDSGRSMMSGFHGLYSLGGIIGAGGVSLLLGLGATPLLAVLGIGAAILAALAYAPGISCPMAAAARARPSPCRMASCCSSACSASSCSSPKARCWIGARCS